MNNIVKQRTRNITAVTDLEETLRPLPAKTFRRHRSTFNNYAFNQSLQRRIHTILRSPDVSSQNTCVYLQVASGLVILLVFKIYQTIVISISNLFCMLHLRITGPKQALSVHF